MDIMTGISAVAQAMNIVKGLREIEKGFDEAEFKLKIETSIRRSRMPRWRSLMPRRRSRASKLRSKP